MLARQQLTEPFVVISGDSLTDIDLAAACLPSGAARHRHHRPQARAEPAGVRRRGGLMKVGLSSASLKSQAGARSSRTSRIQASTCSTPPSSTSFGRAKVTDWSGDVFPKLLKEGEHVLAGWPPDTGRRRQPPPPTSRRTSIALRARLKVQIPGDRVGDSTWIHPEAEVSPGARIDGPALICAGAKVRAGAWVNGPAVIGGYTTVDSGRQDLQLDHVGPHLHRPQLAIARVGGVQVGDDQERLSPRRGHP